ncbi:site-specific integrase [Pseudoduganella sp.]|uniref:site-specific integrase n=1 Tax=Pseudoduganella sp. TaxID=1880898 RepID=UPI0035AEEEDB
MTKKLGLDNHKDLTISLPSGVKIDFDMEVAADRAAYEDAIDKIGVFKQPLTVSHGSNGSSHSAARYRLTDLFSSYKVAKEKVFAEATRAAYYPRVEKFIEQHQAKGIIFIDEIRKPHASDYREEVIKVQDSPLTVDNYTKTLKGFFDFAIEAGKYPFENPFSNLHLVKKSERSKHTDSWLPYSGEEVQRLFVEQFDAYAKRFDKPDLFFAPLISLTTGMRIEEIAQLQVSDVYKDNSVWVLDINDNGDFKEVKTPSSIRKMPLPTPILLTNFLDYHALVKERFGETELLFPYLINTASNGFAKNIGYNWTQYKKELIEVNETQKNFHSLRKTIGAAMVDMEYDLPLRKRILGHSMSGDITQTVYGKPYSLEYIKSCLDKISWGINFIDFQFRFKRDDDKLLDGWVNAKRIKERKKATKVTSEK